MVINGCNPSIVLQLQKMPPLWNLFGSRSHRPLTSVPFRWVPQAALKMELQVNGLRKQDENDCRNTKLQRSVFSMWFSVHLCHLYSHCLRWKWWFFHAFQGAWMIFNSFVLFQTGMLRTTEKVVSCLWWWCSLNVIWVHKVLTRAALCHLSSHMRLSGKMCGCAWFFYFSILLTLKGQRHRRNLSSSLWATGPLHKSEH